MNQLMTLKEVATVLKVGRTTLYRLIRQGVLRSVKIGGARRIAQRELERLMDRKTG